MNKQFLLFAGNDYYPSGGAEDFIGSYDTIEDAIEARDACTFDYDGGWANIFDSKEEKIVRTFSRGTWTEKQSHFDI